jgi:hypothetical protein
VQGTHIESKCPKKMALLLAGLHYRENYANAISTRGQSVTIDFHKYVENIHEFVIDRFKHMGYEIDIFICTNNSPVLEDLAAMYTPVVCTTLPDTCNRRVSKVFRGLNDIKTYCANNKFSYDLYCITRFDIYFNEPILHLDLSKVNVFSILERSCMMDDNFHLFPHSQFEPVYTWLSRISTRPNKFILHHNTGVNLPFHYIKNEHRRVDKLTSFTLHKFCMKN